METQKGEGCATARAGVEVLQREPRGARTGCPPGAGKRRARLLLSRLRKEPGPADTLSSDFHLPER